MSNQTTEVVDFEQQEREFAKAEKEFNEAKEVTTVIANYVNYNRSRKAFTEAFKREHRTLQQSAFKMFLELMEEMATEDYKTDGRNEDSKKVAQRLMEGFKLVMVKEYMAQGVTEARAIEYASGEGAKPSRYLSFI